MTPPNEQARETVARIICGYGPTNGGRPHGPAAQSQWDKSLEKADAILASLSPSINPAEGAGNAVGEALDLVHGDREVVETLLVELDHRMTLKTDKTWRNKNVDELRAERALAAKTIRYLWGKINRARAALSPARDDRAGVSPAESHPEQGEVGK